ncbi:hypothetical protein BU17DRAFT_87524 [Hysterangium stoloniferum]|nr:hypothetical protein BU17DRAFT_87524 [Hysterangium stoloniferum]
MTTLRHALTVLKDEPSVISTMETLGKERTLSRLRHWFRVYLNDKNIKDDEEKRLEALLFGTSFPGAATGVFTNQEAVANDLNVEIGGGLVDSDLFYVDNTGPAFKDDSRQRGDSRAAAVLNSDRKKKAAWVDLDDVNIEVSLASDNRLRKLRDAPVEDIIKGRDYETRLRHQFEKNPDPEWASAARDRLRGQKRRRASQSSQSASASGDEDRITSLINSSGKLLLSQRSLPQGQISIERLRDANQSAKAEGEIRSVKFHPSPSISILLTASADRRLHYSMSVVLSTCHYCALVLSLDRWPYQPTSPIGSYTNPSHYKSPIPPWRFFCAPHGAPSILLHIRPKEWRLYPP